LIGLTARVPQNLENPWPCRKIQPDSNVDRQTNMQTDRYEDRHAGDRQTKMQADKTDSEITVFLQFSFCRKYWLTKFRIPGRRKHILWDPAHSRPSHSATDGGLMHCAAMQAGKGRDAYSRIILPEPPHLGRCPPRSKGEHN
jgi:hypothetical protein